MKTEVLVHRSMWSDDVEMAVRVTHDDGRMSVAKSLTLELHEEGMLMQPTMRLDATAAQMLIDRLWDCGLRPTSEGGGSAGALAATKAHLDDMRTLTFALLKSNAEINPRICREQKSE